MNLPPFFVRSVGAKIAGVTSAVLVFVTFLFLFIFLLLDVPFLSKFTLVQVILAFVVLLVFVEVILLVLTAFVFIQKPLQKLSDVMHIAEEGNLLIRAKVRSHDELGELARSFNCMLAKMTDLDARKLEMERELMAAQASLKFKKELEEKAFIIETTNKKLEESVREISLLYNISQALGRTLEQSELLHQITRILTKELQITQFSLFLFNKEDLIFELKASSGSKNQADLVDVKLKLDEEFVAKMMSEKKSQIILGNKWRGSEEIPGWVMLIPLKIGDRIFGFLQMAESNLRFYESLASQFAMAYDRSLLYMQTKDLSVTDELTSLFNRRHFQDVLQMECKRATRFSRPLSVLMIDVDYFKQFNDRYGHIHGDKVLKKLAQLLVTHVREVDTVARFGGEEFVILLADTSLDHALMVAEKLRVLVQENSFSLNRDKEERSLTISLGVSTFPFLAGTEEDLINTADIALYKAKGKGRNCTVAFKEMEIGVTRDRFSREGKPLEISRRVIQ